MNQYKLGLSMPLICVNSMFRSSGPTSLIDVLVSSRHGMDSQHLQHWGNHACFCNLVKQETYIKPCWNGGIVFVEGMVGME